MLLLYMHSLSASITGEYRFAGGRKSKWDTGSSAQPSGQSRPVSSNPVGALIKK